MQIADELHAKAPNVVHYELDHKGKQATLTEAGLHAVYAKLGRPSQHLIHLTQDLAIWDVRHPDYSKHGMQQSAFTQSRCEQSCSVGLMVDKGRCMNWETGRQNMARSNRCQSISTWATSFSWSAIGQREACKLGNRQACFPSNGRACVWSCSDSSVTRGQISENIGSHDVAWLLPSGVCVHST